MHTRLQPHSMADFFTVTSTYRATDLATGLERAALVPRPTRSLLYIDSG